jgi:hypothetical protein
MTGAKEAAEKKKKRKCAVRGGELLHTIVN